MLDRVLSKEPEELLLGNEAIVRGALEAGVGFTSLIQVLLLQN